MTHREHTDQVMRDRRSLVRNLVIFSLIVLLSGWFGRAVDLLTGNQGPESPGLLIWIVTPVSAALLLRTFAGDGWRDFGLSPAFRGNVKWYLLSIAVFPVVGATLVIVGAAMGWISLSTLSVSALMGGIGVALAPNLFKNLFEEFAWRGYLTPKLHLARVNDVWGHVIVGLIWGLWHVPYYLYFLERSVLESYTSVSPVIFVVMATASIVSWAVVYGEIRLLTGSVWPAVVMHMMEDAFVNTLLLEGHIAIAPEAEWLLSPGFGVLNMVLFLAIGLGLYRLRISSRSASEDCGLPNGRNQ